MGKVFNLSNNQRNASNNEIFHWSNYQRIKRMVFSLLNTHTIGDYTAIMIQTHIYYYGKMFTESPFPLANSQLSTRSQYKYLSPDLPLASCTHPSSHSSQFNCVSNCLCPSLPSRLPFPFEANCLHLRLQVLPHYLLTVP